MTNQQASWNGNFSAASAKISEWCNDSSALLTRTPARLLTRTNAHLCYYFVAPVGRYLILVFENRLLSIRSTKGKLFCRRYVGTVAGKEGGKIRIRLFHGRQAFRHVQQQEKARLSLRAHAPAGTAILDRVTSQTPKIGK